MQAKSRRAFLKTASVAGLVLPLAPAWAQTVRLQTVGLTDKFMAVIGPDANVLVADSNDGLIMVDGGHADWSKDLLDTVSQAFPGKPINTLFNTHWHPEQTGSNLALGEQGTRIVAHENTKLWLGTEVWVRWSDIKYPPLAKTALPTTTFYESGGMQIAEHDIEYDFLIDAHTDGDICVFFPKDNVLMTGGLVSNDGWPVIDWWTGGWTGGMLSGLAKLLEIADENTRIVPANGPVMSVSDLRSQYEMYSIVFERLYTMLEKSWGTEEILAGRPTAEYDAQWGDPTQFLTLAFHSLWGHLRDGQQYGLPRMP